MVSQSFAEAAVDHDQLMHEMTSGLVERLTTQERLKLARKRRKDQLRQFFAREKDLTNNKRRKGVENRSERRRRVEGGVHFVDGVVLLEAAARNDVEEGGIVLGADEVSSILHIPKLVSCFTDGRSGTCGTLQQCPALIDLVRRRPPGYISRLRTAVRRCGRLPRICCVRSGAAGSTRPGQVVFSTRPGVTRPTTPTRQPGASSGRAPAPTRLSRQPFRSPRDCGESRFAPSRIVGGKPVHSQTWFPWMAALTYRTSSRNRQVYRCAGAVINDRWVLTAAHCITDDGPIAARVRDLDLEMAADDDVVNPPEDVEVEEVFRHPEFVRRNRIPVNDIALLKLKKSIVFSDVLKPVCINSRKRTTGQLEDIGRVHIAGWGQTSFDSDQLSARMMWADVNVTRFNTCVENYRRVRSELSPAVQMCAGGNNLDQVFCEEFPETCRGGVDSCRGDSGGPLMQLIPLRVDYRVEVIGIVSFGIGCGNPDLPGVYTRLDSFINWMGDIVAQN